MKEIEKKQKKKARWTHLQPVNLWYRLLLVPFNVVFAVVEMHRVFPTVFWNVPSCKHHSNGPPLRRLSPFQP